MPTLGPQFNQLAMFHPVSDFIKSGERNDTKFYPMDVGGYTPREGRGSYSEMWHQKAKENAAFGAPNLSDPVQVLHGDQDPWAGSDQREGQPALSDGHHRIAALRNKPNHLVPVEHVDPDTMWG